MAKISRAVLQPNLGLYLDRPSVAIPNQGLRDGNNFRILDGDITNINLGCTRFGDFTLNGPVKLVQNFTPRDGTEQLVFATLTDIYVWDSNNEVVLFLTPIYSAGTVTVAATAVTGAGTLWAANAKEGDQISFGAADENDPDATWYTIDEVTDNTHIVLTATAGVVGAGASYTIRQLYTGGFNDKWESEVFVETGAGADLLFLTNGIDDIATWDGSADQVTVQTALGFQAKHLVVFSNMMIYLNLIQGGDSLPTSIINSDPGDPLNVTSGLSEQFVVHDKSVSEIYDAKVLGDNLAIYSKLRVTLVQFLGDPFIFAFRQIGDNIGPIGPGLVANFGDYHEFLGLDNQYKFDGATLLAVNAQVWRVVMRDQDPARNGCGFHFFDPSKGEVVWSIPLTSDTQAGEDDAPNETGWAEHYNEQVGPQVPTPHSRRDFPFSSVGEYTQNTGVTWATIVGTWADLNFKWNEQFFFAAFPQIIVGLPDGTVCTYGTSSTLDGDILPSYVVFPRRPSQDGRMRALVARVYPFCSEVGDPTTIGVSLLLSDSAEGVEVESDVINVPIPMTEGVYFASPFRRARYISPKFSQMDGELYALSGFDMDVRAGGYR